MSSSLLDEFRSLRPRLEAAGAEVVEHLKKRIEVAQIPVHSVTFRVKDGASLAKKLARPDKSYAKLFDVTDLVGVRVETYFEDHVEQVARLIEKHFLVDLAHSSARDRPAGYRSVHYVCAHSGVHPDFRFEVQLRTVLQHAWAEVEHDLGYKADDEVPEQIRRRFARVAGLLEIADEEFVSIRNELANSRERAKLMVERKGDLPIDLVSLDVLTRALQVKELDHRIAVRLGKPMSPEPFFPDYLVKVLRLSGLDTTAAVAHAIEVHGPTLDEGFVRYAAIARSALHFDVAALSEVERGYALLTLAHLHVVRGPELAIKKLARLERLYRELEFPDDEDEAHRVATAIVSGLA